MLSGVCYKVLYAIVRFAMFFWHPVFHVKGREHVNPAGKMMICANHAGMADPIWVIFALKLGHMPRIMAKKELLKVPVLGWFLQKIGVFGVDRGAADIQAIKTGLRCLREEQQLLVFPEGTRRKAGTDVSPKRGALMMAAKTDTPILPVYLTERRYPFSPMTCIIGEPYRLSFAGDKPSDEELKAETVRLMEKIYAMGEAQ